MGSINYGSNYLVNLGLDLNHFDMVYKCEDEETKADLQYDLFLECEAILSKYSFEFYEVTLEPGYYEGFYLKIKNSYNYFSDYMEKYDNQREITQLKKCLVELSEYALNSYSPGWCTAYYDNTHTLKLINEAIKEERERVRLTLTDKNISWDMIMNGIYRRDQLLEE